MNHPIPNPAGANTPNPLATLLPNVTPEPIGWYPIAPGWWLVLILVTAIGLAVLFISLRFARKTAYRRQAMKTLNQIEQSYHQHGQMKQLVKDCNTLLKATALRAWPREQVASLNGKAWLTFLDNSLSSDKSQDKNSPDSRKFRKGPGLVLGSARYSDHQVDPRITPEKLLELMRYWIREHKVVVKEAEDHG